MPGYLLVSCSSCGGPKPWNTSIGLELQHMYSCSRSVTARGHDASESVSVGAEASLWMFHGVPMLRPAASSSCLRGIYEAQLGTAMGLISRLSSDSAATYGSEEVVDRGVGFVQ